MLFVIIYSCPVGPHVAHACYKGFQLARWVAYDVT